MPSISTFSNIFVSYSRRDAEFVRKVDSAFKKAGLEVWVDWEDIPLSVDWWEEIKSGIESADVFVFIITPDSVASEVCYNEIDHAIKHNKRFVPVLYREIDRVALKDKLHPAISSHNWVFFRDTDEFEVAFQNLLTTVNADFSHLRTHTRLLVRAREWQERNGDRSSLLTGRELDEALQWLRLNKEKSPQPTELHREYIHTSNVDRGRRRQIGCTVVVAIILFAALSAALFASLNTVNRLLVLTQQNAEENAAIARSVSLLVANSETILREGDTYRALPFALAAVQARPLPVAQMVLASVVYSPGPQKWILEHADAINLADTSPVDRTALTAGADGLIALWDLDTGEMLAEYRQHERAVNSVAFLPDGSGFASAGSDGRVLLWDRTTGTVRVIVQLSDRATTVDISPDGRWIAAGFYLTNNTTISSDDGYRLLVWDLESGAQSQQVIATGEWVQSMTFAPDSSSLLTGMNSGRILQWAVTPDPVGPSSERYSAKPIRILDQHDGDVYDLAFDPTGAWLASASADYYVFVWNFDTGQRSVVLTGHTDVVTGVDFVPGTNFLFSSGLDRNLILWDLSTGQPNRILTGHRSLPSTVAVSYDGARAISGSNSGVGIIWDLAVEDLIETYGELQAGHIRRVAYSADGAQALAGYTDGHIALWNLQNGTIQHEMTGHAPGAVYDIAFAFNDAVAVSAGSDNLLRLWNLETGEQIGEALAGHSESIWDIDVSADGTQALSGSQDGDVILWDLQTGEILRRYDNLNNGLRILTIEFSPDGRSAIASSNSYLFRFDLLTGAIVQSYRGHSESIVGMAISPDGKLLASSDFRRAVLVRDLETGEILHSFFGHRSAIWGVAFSPDSQLVVSASDDGDIVLWDLQQDSISRRFSRSSGVIRSVLFSTDGNYVLFGDTHLRRLRFLDPQQIITWVEQNRLVQSLTCAEQGAYSLIALCDEDTTVRSAQIGENRGQIYRDAGLTWMLDARAGQQLDIRVLADHPAGAVVGIERRQILRLLDTVLMVVSPSGIILGTNDDVTDEDSNSQLLDLVLPEDGTYRIEVSSFDGATSGDYTLLIEESGSRSP